MMTGKDIPRSIRFAIMIAILGMVGLAYVGYDIAQQRQERDEQVSCITDVLYDSIKATNERTTYSEELSAANENQLKAFRALVVATLSKPPPTDKESRELVENYADALDAYFDVSEKASRKRENFPYPTSQEVAACSD